MVYHMKNISVMRWCGILLLAVSCVYTIWYMQLGDIFKNSGALSTIGLDHPVLFAVWGILAQGAMLLNIGTMYKRAGIHKKFYKVLLALSTLGMAMTLLFPFDYDMRLYYFLHCTGAFLFTGTNGAAILIYFLLRRREHPAFWALFGCGCAVLSASVILLLITKETAFNETLPQFGAFLLFAANNATKLGAPPKWPAAAQQGTKNDETKKQEPARRA